METLYILSITLIAISAFVALYFIVRANNITNQRMLERLSNHIMANDVNEYIVLNEADVKKEKRQTPEKAKDTRFIPMDDEHLEEIIEHANSREG